MKKKILICTLAFVIIAHVVFTVIRPYSDRESNLATVLYQSFSHMYTDIDEAIYFIEEYNEKKNLLYLELVKENLDSFYDNLKLFEMAYNTKDLKIFEIY